MFKLQNAGIQYDKPRISLISFFRRGILLSNIIESYFDSKILEFHLHTLAYTNCMTRTLLYSRKNTYTMFDPR